jgi:hypothetical protein
MKNVTIDAVKVTHPCPSPRRSFHPTEGNHRPGTEIGYQMDRRKGAPVLNQHPQYINMLSQAELPRHASILTDYFPQIARIYADYFRCRNTTTRWRDVHLQAL